MTIFKNSEEPRQEALDSARGLACFLMLVAHIAGGYAFSAGTYAAPIFFAFSGIISAMQIEKIKGKRFSDLFFLIFAVLLFIGGFLQIIIIKKKFSFDAEFFQLISCSMICIFILSKVFKSIYRAGWFFPIIFILFWSITRFYPNLPGNLRFIISKAQFSLFPWFGFFLFGLFLQARTKKIKKILLLILLLAAVILSAFNLKPIKAPLNLTYVLHALGIITAVYLYSEWLSRSRINSFKRKIHNLLSLYGRNSLFFVFLHYFLMQTFLTLDFTNNLVLLIWGESLFLYLLAFPILKLYEMVKYKHSSIKYFLVFFSIILLLRHLNLLHQSIYVNQVDLIIGLCFAFLFVQLRHFFRKKLNV